MCYAVQVVKPPEVSKKPPPKPAPLVNPNLPPPPTAAAAAPEAPATPAASDSEPADEASATTDKKSEDVESPAVAAANSDKKESAAGNAAATPAAPFSSPSRSGTVSLRDNSKIAELEEEVQELKRKLERAESRNVSGANPFVHRLIFYAE